jgi:predicted site-specific integrase-resolvase
MRERYSEMAAKQASANVKPHRVFGQARKPAKMFRAGLYARVSTHDRQTLPLQNRAMREYAAKRGWTIAMQVKEVGSGASDRGLREKLLEASRRREIDVVLVWRLDRWTVRRGSRFDVTGTGASRSRFRIADRSARSDGALRASDGWPARGVRPV